ncbi:MAG: glycosyltransferase [Planctomycetaceae bacterium]
MTLVMQDRPTKSTPRAAGRIAHVLGWYFPEALGGTEIYVAGLSHRMQAAGWDVRIAAPLPGEPDGREYEHDGVPVFRYPIPPNPTRDECRGTAPVRGAEVFHCWLGKIQPDIVHFHTFSTGIGPREVTAARESGARVFATTHLPALGYLCQRGTMLRWGEELCDGICRPAKCAACSLHQRGAPKPLARVVGGMPGLASELLGRMPGRSGTMLGMNGQIRRNLRMQNQILRDVEKYVVLTQWAYDAMIHNDAPPEKVVLNRLGHGHVSVTRKPSPDARPTRTPVRFGFVGRLNAVKGADILARAVASLPRSLPFTVEFCGPTVPGGGRSVETQLLEILGDDPRVTFREPVAPCDVPDLLASYDVLVIPSLWLEGGPTVAIEAQAVGTPIIGTPMGGLAELVTNGVDGRHVPPRDIAELAVAMRTVVEDPGEIDRWRTALPAARTMDDVTRDYLELYRG